MAIETTNSAAPYAAPPASHAGRAAWLFTGVGAIAVAVICLVVNYLSAGSTAQVDFTASKMHTLADGTKEMLKDLKSDDAPVTVKVFVSPDDDLGNANWLVQLRDLRSMLDLFRTYAGKNLKVELRRPSPDTDDEDAAEQAGVRPYNVGGGREAYFGVAATCLDKTSTVQFIPAIDAPLLEYKLVRAIYRVRPAPKKVVGLMTPLEMDGGMMAFMGQGTPPTYFYRELSEDYDVVKIEVTANEIKTNEYTDYTLNYADGSFTRQEYKNGSPGTKGNGTFSVAGGEKDKADPNAKGVNGGKTPEKLEAISYILTEGGNANVLTFTGQTTGEQSGSGKKEGFAYSFTKTDDTKATVQVRKGIDVLVIVHPAGITDEAQWAVDQFILKGGKVVALVDSFSFIAQQSRPQPNPFMRQQQPQGVDPSSSLQKLFTAWGYSYDNNNVVADITYQAANFGNPAIISPPSGSINHNELVSKDLNNFIFAFTGGLAGKAGFGLKEETLIETSKDTMLLNSTQLNQRELQKLHTTFVSSGDKRALAVKVTGKFPSAFPQGKPDAPPPPPPGGGGGGSPFGAGFGQQGAQGPAGEAAPAQTPPAAPPAPTVVPAPPAASENSPAPAATPAQAEPKPAATPATPPASPPPATATTPPVSVTTPPVSVTTPPVEVPPVVTPPVAAPGTPTPTIPAAPAAPAKPKVPSLAQGEADATVYVIADSDLISDQVNLRQDRPREIAEPTTSNLPLVFNMIDELAGNTGLIQARSRTSSERPFTKLNEILEQTNKGLREEQKKIEEDIAKWRQEITSKSTQKNPNSPFIYVDQSQMEELQSRVDEGEAKKRDLRKKFRRNIDAKFAWIQGLNIFGVPLLILLTGLAVVIIRKTQTAAR